MQRAFLFLLACLVGMDAPLWGEDAPDSLGAAQPPEIAPPPEELELDPFYRKCVLVHGFPVVCSERVHDAALREAAWLIERMLVHRPDVLEALAASRTRFTVMACDEMTTMIPEHSDLTPSKYWDRRARGLGATHQRPCVSCGEENLLRYPGDPYRAENILIHEFAHAIHEMGLNRLDDQFDEQLNAIYDQAMEDKLWEDKYAATNHHEYWAEGVQSYFDTNRENDHDHNHVDTRDELAEYDPRLFALIDDAFRQNAWRYVRPEDRPEEQRTHLAGYDPAIAPTFQWPDGLEEWYREYEHNRDGKR
jgi:hypothetical protein